MTTKTRSSSDDHTRALRAGRRNAILDAAAVRMGRETWTKFESEVRQALETADTDGLASANLRLLFTDVTSRIKDGQPDQPPADIQKALSTYPIRKAGRPPAQPQQLSPEASPVVSPPAET